LWWEGCGEGFWGACSGSDCLASVLLAKECLVLRDEAHTAHV